MNAPNQFARPHPPIKKSRSSFWIIFSVITFIFVLVFNKFLGALSYNFFVSGDNILKLSSYLPPFIMWGIGGLLIGSVVGSIIVANKYKLPFKWILPSIGLNVLVFTILLLISKPFLTNQNEHTVKRRDGSKYVEVIASSSIPKYGQYEFGPDKLLDNNYNTAWMYIEQANKTAWVKYIFNGKEVNKVSNIKLTSFRLHPGYQKNYDKFEVSNKPKDYIVYKNEEKILQGTLEDRFGNHQIDFDNVEIKLGDTIKVEIISTYKPVPKKVNIITITDMYPELSFRESKLH